MPYVKNQLECLWEPRFVRAVFHDVLTLSSLHEDGVVPIQAEQIVAKLTKPKQACKFQYFLLHII